MAKVFRRVILFFSLSLSLQSRLKLALAWRRRSEQEIKTHWKNKQVLIKATWWISNIAYARIITGVEFVFFCATVISDPCIYGLRLSRQPQRALSLNHSRFTVSLNTLSTPLICLDYKRASRRFRYFVFLLLLAVIDQNRALKGSSRTDYDD